MAAARVARLAGIGFVERPGKGLRPLTDGAAALRDISMVAISRGTGVQSLPRRGGHRSRGRTCGRPGSRPTGLDSNAVVTAGSQEISKLRWFDGQKHLWVVR